MELGFNSVKNNALQFGAAKDINLLYIARKRAKNVPSRVLEEINIKLSEPNVDVLELPSLRKVHDEVYNPLMQAKTLSEAKLSYPEFEDVVELSELSWHFSRTKKKIEKVMPIDKFSLDCLQKTWSGMPVEDIVKSYGFSARDVLANLCKHLHIPKPPKNYYVLLKTSEEEGNRAVAQKTLQHIDKSIENLKKAGNKAQSPEARKKQAEGIQDFYRYRASARDKKREVMLLTWDLCPEVKLARAEFLKTQPSFVGPVLVRQKNGQKLAEMDKRIVRSFNKRFWNAYPHLKAEYAKARSTAEKMLKDDK